MSVWLFIGYIVVHAITDTVTSARIDKLEIKVEELEGSEFDSTDGAA